MRLLVAIAASLALASCQSKPIAGMTYAEKRAIVDKFVATCESQGAKHPSAQFEQCIRQEASSYEYSRVTSNARRAAIGNALAEAGQNMQNNRPVNCTSTRFGNTVNTNCY